jgi:hypothetical protein
MFPRVYSYSYATIILLSTFSVSPSVRIGVRCESKGPSSRRRQTLDPYPHCCQQLSVAPRLPTHIPMASPASHKPRRRRKIEDGSLAHVNHGTLDLDHSTQTRKPAFPLVAFLWPAKGTVSQWVTIPLVLMVVGLFRWTTSLWGYSGFESPPMHGDFEAQRHWMEITRHLPARDWYFYELEWWGLDYPPLTAYHSWILGMM